MYLPKGENRLYGLRHQFNDFMKTFVGIFAHPDDESLGPSGTIAKFAKDHDVYIICATRGEAQESGREARKKLGKIREQELLASAKILGVKKVYFLNYTDGTLSNNKYHQIARKIERILDRLRPETLLTFEKNGVSGHLDHIAMSMISTYVFYRLSYVKTILYYCLNKNYQHLMNDYFIYFPPGYHESEIDKTVDITDVWETRLAAMNAHASQKEDVQRILTRRKGFPKEEYFLILKK